MLCMVTLVTKRKDKSVREKKYISEAEFKMLLLLHVFTRKNHFCLHKYVKGKTLAISEEIGYG